MASKLFHAIVGVGIAMGAMTACEGEVDNDVAADGGDTDAVADATKKDSSASDAGIETDAAKTKDATALDSTVADAADASLDAPVDALLDAFCDAPWPTTKGSPPLPACINEAGACQQGMEFPCSPGGTSVFACPSGGQVSSMCVGTTWQCPAGTRPTSECVCFTPIPDGWECTDAGIQPIDAGDGG